MNIGPILLPIALEECLKAWLHWLGAMESMLEFMLASRSEHTKRNQSKNVVEALLAFMQRFCLVGFL